MVRRRLLLVLFVLWLVVPLADAANFMVGRYTHINGVVWLVAVSVWNACVGMWFLRRRIYR